ncbi:MAG TPA: (5-formylfuran-3-yl)methyl phosphate synthase [Gemmatimonadales bacterium]|nr:(5-formylfuran-3-yl)methyl phosphate synthase [Gemmatimonadales bacterium]
MRLLVSVRDVRDARAAVRGGADIVDAKDPRRGALGPVTPRILACIRSAVPSAIPVSAALGDAAAERAVPRGAAYVKVGLRDVGGARRARSLVHRVVQRAIEAGAELVLVAYADCARARSLPPLAVVEIAAAGGARGVLLDTAFKNRGSLFELLDVARVAQWLAAAHGVGLFTALAGSLSEPGLRTALALGADIVGVRGAACDGGRMGRVSVSRVRALSALVAAAVA